jgi:hypothetical protein
VAIIINFVLSANAHESVILKWHLRSGDGDRVDTLNTLGTEFGQ